MIGQTISHYRILEKLGEGGMGVVYKAEDVKLKRSVALKFLPPEFTRDEEAKARFVREAQAVSALQHNNICTIHEIDETEDGRVFISMDYYAGETLEKRIARAPLELNEVTDIVNQIAQGLSRAHEVGIVHRDIKPANVMLTREGVVKILDFGLAKLAGQTRVTRTGTSVGTVAYMSPEQVRGEEVDCRSDIFSLGALSYELLTGHVAFSGDHQAAAMYAIVHSEPKPLDRHRVGIPGGFQKIVDKCLEKDAGKRYQNVVEVASDLKRLQASVQAGMEPSGSRIDKPSGPHAFLCKGGRRSTLLRAGVAVAGLVAVLLVAYFLLPQLRQVRRAGPGAARKMVAVLPFQNLGPPEDEYFVDGITDAITARLAGVHGLGVISRQSSMQYKNTSKSLQEIGRELGVAYVLEGTVQRERPSDPTSRVRVIPQLVSVSEDVHVWAGTYDEEFSQVFAVQSEIAEKVAQALDVTLLSAEKRSLESKPTDNLEAYEYYLRGTDFYRRRLNREEAVAAVEMYQKAVELDPQFAAAWAALAQAHTWLSWDQQLKDELPKAEAALEKARKISPNANGTHMAEGYYYYYGSRDYRKALKHFSIVQERDPNEVEAIKAIGWIKRRQGKWEEAVALMKTTLELSPQDLDCTYALGQTYLLMRRYTESGVYLDRALSMDRTLAAAYQQKAILFLILNQDKQRAEQELELGLRRTTAAVWDFWSLPLTRILPGIYERVVAGLRQEGSHEDIEVALCLLTTAELDLLREERVSAIARYDSTRALMEPLVRRGGDDYWPHFMLAFAHAGLSQKQAAIREARRVEELLPVSADAHAGAILRSWLIDVYMKVGEYNTALEELEFALSVPSEAHVGLLEFDPIWDPLRGDPRFQRLLKKYSRDK